MFMNLGSIRQHKQATPWHKAHSVDRQIIPIASDIRIPLELVNPEEMPLHMNSLLR